MSLALNAVLIVLCIVEVQTFKDSNQNQLSLNCSKGKSCYLHARHQFPTLNCSGITAVKGY